MQVRIVSFFTNKSVKEGGVMARRPNEKVIKAYELYKTGMRLVDIAGKLDVPAGTVRRWKATYAWDSEHGSERSDQKKANARKESRRKKGKKEAAADEVESVMQNGELNDKQKLFCIYYARCFNATKAYQKAYNVDYNIAASIGYRMLKNDGVKEEILRLKKSRLNRAFFSEEDLFQKYLDIAFADMTDFMEFGTKDIQVVNPDTQETEGISVSYANIKDSGEVDGTLISEVSKGKDGVKVKLADRMKAMQWLSDHMDLATEEQKAHIEQMRAQTEKMQSDMDKGEEGPLEIIFRKAGDVHAGGTKDRGSE